MSYPQAHGQWWQNHSLGLWIPKPVSQSQCIFFCVTVSFPLPFNSCPLMKGQPLSIIWRAVQWDNTILTCRILTYTCLVIDQTSEVWVWSWLSTMFTGSWKWSTYLYISHTFPNITSGIILLSKDDQWGPLISKKTKGELQFTTLTAVARDPSLTFNITLFLIDR